MSNDPLIDNPGLDWRDGGLPVSGRFGDVYFSADNGLEETRHVFLSGCGLPEAWAGRDVFVIGETGFGTGLNFLAAWDLWRKTAPQSARLHFVTVEGFPLRAADLALAHRAFPELADLSAQLCAVYPEPQPGFHRVFLDNGRVTLTLMFGEAEAMFGTLEARVDAWFLDGFAPSKNPEMWRSAVLGEIARLSVPGARLATFTAAGAVRRGLAEVGFAVQKVPGFGSKRDMTVAVFEGATEASKLEPWFDIGPVTPPKSVAVIGGGLAGCTVAEALTRRGIDVTLFEARGELAGAASGNPMGIMMPRLTADRSLAGRFFAAGYPFALGTRERFCPEGDACGVLHMAETDKEADRQGKIVASGLLPEALLSLASPDEASRLAGVPIDRQALWYPQAGWVKPPDFCSLLVENAQIRLGEPGDPTRLRDDFDAVVIANALDARTFGLSEWLPFAGQAGQISLVTPTNTSAPLNTVLAWGGYATPVGPDGLHCLGATHHPWDGGDPNVTEHAHNQVMTKTHDILPGLFEGGDIVRGRASVRCTTPDRLPTFGPLPDFETYREAYAPLRHDAKLRDMDAARPHPHLWLASGLGSRGLVTAPLAAEILVSRMMGEPWPIERELATLIDPARFIIRGLIRREI